MHRTKKVMLAINLIGGTAVLGSYAQGLSAHPGSAPALWGGVPEWLRPAYTVGMLLAAAGYFAFSYFLFLRSDPERARIFARGQLALVNWLYVGILLPSALWMPLTYAWLSNPASSLWVAIRLVLAVVGLSSLGLFVALLGISPKEPRWAHRLAVAGSLLFVLHTGLLDAIIWPALFPFP